MNSGKHACWEVYFFLTFKNVKSIEIPPMANNIYPGKVSKIPGRRSSITTKNKPNNKICT